MNHSPTRWCLNVWGGMQLDYIVKGLISSMEDAMVNFWQNNFYQPLEHITFHFRARLWFSHDGTPVNYAVPILNHLNNEYTGQWMRIDGHCRWPAR